MRERRRALGALQARINEGQREDFMNPRTWGLTFTESIRVLDMAYFDCPIERVRVIGFTGNTTGWPCPRAHPTSPRTLRIFDSLVMGTVMGLSAEPRGPLRSVTVPAPQPRSGGRPYVHVADPAGNIRCITCPLDQVLALMTFPAECKAAFVTDQVVSALGGRRGTPASLPLRRMLERSLPPRFMYHFVHHAVHHAASERLDSVRGVPILHFVDAFCGIGGASIGAFLAVGNRARFYALDMSAAALAVYRQMLISIGVLEQDIIACRCVDMTLVTSEDIARLLRGHVHPGDISWLHQSPPCDQISRVQTQGGAHGRWFRRREGMWKSYCAARLYSECITRHVVDVATFENTCSLIPGRHKPPRGGIRGVQCADSA